MDANDRWTTYESPLGVLTIAIAPDGALKNLFFPDQAPDLDDEDRCLIEPVTTQLDEYFAGTRQNFELPLDLVGAPLRMQVWEQLCDIPFGTTISYGELTDSLDPYVFPASLEPYERVRAAAGAIARTPVPIVIPCHRVLGANGSLTGYGGGIERKRILLELERLVTAGLSPEGAWTQHQLAIL